MVFAFYQVEGEIEGDFTTKVPFPKLKDIVSYQIIEKLNKPISTYVDFCNLKKIYKKYNKHYTDKNYKIIRKLLDVFAFDKYNYDLIIDPIKLYAYKRVEEAGAFSLDGFFSDYKRSKDEYRSSSTSQDIDELFDRLILDAFHRPGGPCNIESDNDLIDYPFFIECCYSDDWPNNILIPRDTSFQSVSSAIEYLKLYSSYNDFTNLENGTIVFEIKSESDVKHINKLIYNIVNIFSGKNRYYFPLNFRGEVTIRVTNYY